MPTNRPVHCHWSYWHCRCDTTRVGIQPGEDLFQFSRYHLCRLVWNSLHYGVPSEVILWGGRRGAATRERLCVVMVHAVKSMLPLNGEMQTKVALHRRNHDASARQQHTDLVCAVRRRTRPRGVRGRLVHRPWVGASERERGDKRRLKKQEQGPTRAATPRLGEGSNSINQSINRLFPSCCPESPERA